MEAKMCEAREMNWCDLLPELILVISKKLPKLSDFVRFRAVCKRWRSSTSISDPPPQLPWIFETRTDVYPASKLDKELLFYSPFTGEACYFDVNTSFEGKNFLGPNHGYLLLCDIRNYMLPCYLFNPLTNKEICLPSLERHISWPAWTSTDPMHSRVQVVISNRKTIHAGCTFYGNNELLQQQVEWFVVERELSRYQGLSYSCCYFRGMIFLSKRASSTEVFSLETSTSTKLKLFDIPPPKDELSPFLCPTIYLIESAGQLLRVSYNSKFCNTGIQGKTEYRFRIYRLEFDERNWVKIKGIGDQILFLELIDGFSVSSTPFPGIKGNCVYFLDQGSPHRYDIEDGKVEWVRTTPFQKCSWFLPSLQ